MYYRTRRLALLSIFATLLIGSPLLYAPFLAVQAKVTVSGSERPIPVIRLTQADSSALPIRLEGVSIDAEVQGTQSITSIELSFFNPNTRIMEGQLEFPLLDGQSVIALAMDVNGKLRDAVPVEKAKGQQVFEDVVRQKIDPALLEVTQGNQYRLRVYPIPANGTKRVVLKIADNLALSEQQLVYRLPLKFAQQLPRLQLAMRVFASASSSPPVASGSVKDLTFTRRGEVYEGQIDRQRVDMQGVFEVRIPTLEKASLTTQSFGGKTYFQAEVPTPKLAAQPRRIASNVVLYWDASGSGATREFSKEFSLLDSYFRAMGEGEVSLVRFRDNAEAPLTFKISKGNWQALKTALEKTEYDGATAYGAITSVPNAKEALLFSDGLNNFDGKSFPKLEIPVYVFSSTVGADISALRLFAMRSGGQFADLLTLPIAEAAQRVTHQEVTLERVEGEGVSDVHFASNRSEQGRWLITGVLSHEKAAKTDVRVILRLPDGKTDILSLAVSSVSSSKLAAYTWARLRIADLEGERVLKRGEIRRIGESFRIPTPETSLIVLDRIEDYAQHKIEPPEELKVEYDRLMAQGVQAQQREQGTHLEQVVQRFQHVQQWWNKDFPKDNVPKQPEVNRDNIPEGAAIPMTSPPAPTTSTAEPRADRSDEMAKSDDARASRPKLKREGRTRTSGHTQIAADGGKKDDAKTDQGAVITLKKWQSDAPYIARFQSATATDLYRVYMDERPSWANSSAFYLDAADVLFDKGQQELAIRVLSNLAEMNLENRHILRILAYRLMQAKRATLAIPVLEKVRELSPNEPQSHRDLGLAYAENGQTQLAIDALYKVVSHPWHGRFPDVELITLAELNAIIANAKEKIDVARIDPRLIKNLPLDLRVVLSWDADNTDIDLWVTDPNGEKAFYSNALTYQGGAMSRDFTGGYGPETFSLKKAKPGKYLIQAEFYGHRQQIVAGATTLQVKLTTGFGTKKQSEKVITLRLKQNKETVMVGEFEVDGKP